VCAAIAARAECDRAREALLVWRPIADADARERELEALAEALRRQGEPGHWCSVGQGSLAALLDPESREMLDGPLLLEVLGWLEAARSTREAWVSAALRERFPVLADVANGLPDLETLRERLARSLDPDGRVKDDASPALRRARAGLQDGERRLHQQLERWVSGVGEGGHVTRFHDRFVAVVAAAGFSRKRGIVHDTSNSGQSLYVEPLEICEANNHLLELRGVADEESRRILRELAEGVEDARDALLASEELLARLDGLRARARWAGDFGGITVVPGPGPLLLSGARHPLLAMGARAASLVPLDLELREDGRLLLVSGPNMGGKTIVLKTVGLAVAMAHAAFPVLAREGTRVPVIDAIVVDLGDEQSVDQGLSTFAAHLQRLRAMAEAAGPHSLLLADELGAGTDPEEGAALGRALVEHFAATRSWGVLTTHLGSLKRVAGEVAGVVNGSLEFDRETLTPRYRFMPGVPGASHALSVAARLGFPPAVLERANALTSDETRALERLLSEIGAALQAAQAERAELAAARERAAAAEALHLAATEDARKTLSELRKRLTAESEAILARVRELWQTMQRDAKRAERSKAGADTFKQGMQALERDAEALRQKASPAAVGLPEAPAPAVQPFKIAVGTRVRVADLGIEAEIATLPDAEGRLQLKRGVWNIQSHVSKLSAAAASAPAPVRGGATYKPESEEAVPALEVDLRGMEVDEALRAVDHGLDRAVLGGVTELRIIHGIGRGVLKAAVEKHLRAHPQVESQRMGEGFEGGRGVTVARMR
jgi:DNA mismatch repair protein MutS2